MVSLCCYLQLIGLKIYLYGSYATPERDTSSEFRVYEAKLSAQTVLYVFLKFANVAKKQPLRYQTQKNPRRLYFKCADGKCNYFAWWAPTTQHDNASNIQWRLNLIHRKNEDEGRNDSNRNNES
ncbi:unnamed protein product [Camellia sinensis]